MRTAQKFFVTLILSLGLLIFPNLTFAQGNIVGTPSTSLSDTVNIDPTTVTQTSPYYANIVIINLVHTLSCLAEGKSIIGEPCITNVRSSKATGSLPIYQAQIQSNGGAIGMIGGLFTLVYTTPPIRTTEYLANAGKELGIISPAYAQVEGSGNNVLSPIFKLWELSRNISYLAMILIFITVGIMIMFRRKINPQTVISVQKALPSLVVGLILITFSYFIAALIVDLTFVGTQLGIYTLDNYGILEKGPLQSWPQREIFL